MGRDEVQSSRMLGAEERDRLCVVLVATRNPLNMGAAARAMSNFGFHHLRVVRPYDVAFREARSAVDAGEVLAHAEEFPNIAEAVGDRTLVVGTTAVGGRKLQRPLFDLPSGAPLIQRELCRPAPATGRVALLFGPEKTGLSNADLDHCHWLLRVPTRAEHRSLNLGQAVAICLYELARTGPVRAATLAQSVEQGPIATVAAQERTLKLLLEVALASDHRHMRSAQGTEEMLRGLIQRSHLLEKDAATWAGILRRVLWKLQHKK